MNLENELDRRLYQKSIKLGSVQQQQKEMLDHMNQAILTINSDLSINESYSKHLYSILGESKPIAGANVMTAIFNRSSLREDALRRLTFDLQTVFGGDDLQWLCTAHAMPSKCTLEDKGKIKHISLIYQPIYSEKGTIERIMLIMEDVTAVQKLESEASQKQAELNKLTDILAVEDHVYHGFMEEARNIVRQCQSHLKNIHSNLSSESDVAVDSIFASHHTCAHT